MLVSSFIEQSLTMKRSFEAVLGLSLFFSWSVFAEEWPQFRHDASRSGYTSDSLSFPLGCAWVFGCRHLPSPAWKGEDTRMPFDYAPQMVVSEGRIYFGSSADCKIYALDANNGYVAWSFFAEGPVRFAPVVWREKLFCLSDDGFLYCLDKHTGKLYWRKRGGPIEDSLLGNGKMISRWPCRGGAVLHKDLLYYGAGIWPTEGIYLYAIDPETGAVQWANEDAGSMEMDQPHNGARAQSGISCQGYLATDGKKLLIPTGRACPAAIGLEDGEFLYFHLQKYGSGSSKGEGPFITVVDDAYVSHKEVFFVEDGQFLGAGIQAEAIAVSPISVVFAKEGAIYGLKREAFLTEKRVVERKAQDTRTRRFLGGADWSLDLDSGEVTCMIQTGDVAVMGTTERRVVLVDLSARQVVDNLEVRGIPLGLAAADAGLYVSTDQGTITCFRPQEEAGPKDVWASAQSLNYKGKPLYVQAAKEILSHAGIKKGWCLDLGCGKGRLAYELAMHSDLNIVAVNSDEAQVQEARIALDRTGLYGERITVFHRSLKDTSLPNHFADLIVSSRSLREDSGFFPHEEALRMLRPYGGMLILGRMGQMRFESLGKPEGAGSWTHQYADVGNTGCSSDQIIKGPLGMLWFKDNEWEMPSRHGRGPSPLFSQGVVVVDGLHGLEALNAYNGQVLWEYSIPNMLRPFDQEHLNGVAITGSNFCLDKESVYVKQGSLCHRLDLFTGEERGDYRSPISPNGEKGQWGTIAVHNGILLGSLLNDKHTVVYAYGKSDMSELFSESLCLFATDIATGRLLWNYTARDSIRNNAIAWGGGHVYLIDRPIAVQDRKKNDTTPHQPGVLLALAENTGEVAWRAEEPAWGTTLLYSEMEDILLMAYQKTRFSLNSEKGGSLSAYRGGTGDLLWNVKADYQSRPLIVGKTVYAQPGAWDLLTGDRLDFSLSRSYGCGILSASSHLLAYRSATLGFLDLEVERGTENYGGIRPGCWINSLPVGGLLLLPEASNRCHCSYLIKATAALQQYGIRPPILSPKGGTYRKPVRVSLKTEDQESEIRYTVDGSSPSEDSLLYQGSLIVKDETNVKARCFKEGLPPSSLTEAYYKVNPNILEMGGKDWFVYDPAGGAPKQSRWETSDGVVSERSNFYVGEADDSSPKTERAGTLRVYRPGLDWRDGVLKMELSSEDDDGLGVVFRYQSPDRYYVWTMDKQRNFHVLAKKNGQAYEVLAVKEGGYRSRTWYALKIELKGSDIQVFLGGKQDLSATDRQFKKGSFALYSWGSTGACFRNIIWSPNR